MPAFSFVMDTAVWQMETNCTVQAPEWQRAGECQARRWKTMRREPQVFVGDSDLTDPSIKYLLKSGRKGISTGCSEIGRIDYGSFVPSWWHGVVVVVVVGGWSGSPETLRSAFSKLTTNRMSDKFPRTDAPRVRSREKNKQEAQQLLQDAWRRGTQFTGRATFFLSLSKIASGWKRCAVCQQCDDLVRLSF